MKIIIEKTEKKKKRETEENEKRSLTNEINFGAFVFLSLQYAAIRFILI